MPVVEVHIPGDQASETMSQMVNALRQAVRGVVSGPDANVTVLVREHVAEICAGSSHSRTFAPAPPDPSLLVLDYLRLMEARNRPAAQEMLSEDFQMVFPGTGPILSLSALVKWAARRYRFVSKTCSAVEAFRSEGATVVYVRGTLSGAWLDGSEFDGIRFIDRFEVRDGKIMRQDVWNDMAEVRPE